MNARTGWKVLQDVSYKGVIYSRGSLLPKGITPAEIARLEARGAVVSIDGVRRAPGPAPESPSEGPAARAVVETWLRGHDIAVLRRLRGAMPNEVVLGQIKDLAVQQHRSPVLIEALRLLAKEPLEVDGSRRPVRRSA